MKEEVKLVIGVSGIYVFYLMYGIYQENVTSHKFGEEQERFKYTSFVLFFQSIINAVCAFGVIKVMGLKEDKTPKSVYAASSLSSIFAMFCSNQALMYVDYPSQVLGKSCKCIPVMIMGLLIKKKTYPFVKYLSVVLVTIGIALFMMPGGGTHKAGGTESSALGLFLLVVSLGLDGVTGTLQDEMMSKYHNSKKGKTTAPYVMFYSNIWASVYMFFVVLLFGDLFPAISFCRRHPEIIPQIFLLSWSSALGQNFIYYTMQNFGALTLATITTTRKFFTILASIIWFGHTLTMSQWIAVSLVFTGLGSEIVESYVRNSVLKKH
eukprot:TRINITY_DN2652_c0_g1_i1.p1 TRINITY_DN2652_c0_g1~~TRINITY_DN2652_c0_g1_i1.p1  ORF type:complete len:343 (-),score=79.63 TRINITY_DN2652_c0_g1_i1:12-977(-)